MKKVLKIIFWGIVSVSLVLYAALFFYVRSMKADEKYPEDSYLGSVNNKTAVIVTAHDDDAYTFSGTIAKLVSEGWNIRQISFKRRDERKNELFYSIARIEGLKGVDLITPDYRIDLDTNKATYMPFDLSLFPVIFRTDTVYGELEKLLNKYKPVVIFSLDDSIGGYGHPDHLFISRQVVEYCNRNRVNPGFFVKRIYQFVFTPSMSRKIILENSWSKISPFREGMRIYHCAGMQVPDVEIKISSWSGVKKDYMNSFSAHDRKNIQKFAQFYNWFPAWIYFRIFDKEHFRVINIENRAAEPVRN